MSKKSKENYYKNHAKNRERLNKYYYDNHDEEKENRRNHYQRNKSIYLSNNYLRDERIKTATPIWLNESELKDIRLKYKIAQRLRNLNGAQYHVDHIVPICGEIVCGLHVPWNLQVIFAEENLRKGNKFETEI